MAATPSYAGIIVLLLLIGVIGLFIVGFVKLIQSVKNSSGSSGLWLMLPLVVLSGMFILAMISYGTVSQDVTIPAVEVTESSAPTVQHVGNGFTVQARTQSYQPSQLSGSESPPVHLKVDLLGFLFLFLIGGACCFVFYVFLVSRKPAEPRQFRPQSLVWLLPVVGMWGLVSWFFVQGVLASRGYAPVQWNAESDLLLENGGFDEGNVVAWYKKLPGPRLLESETEEIKGEPGPYPDWIYDAQKTQESTTAYMSPGNFVLMGTGDTEEEAVQHALEKAVPNAVNHFRLANETSNGSRYFPPSLLKETVTDLYAVKGTVETGLGDSFDMYRVWLRFSLDSDSNIKAYKHWKESLIENRAWAIICFIGFLVFSFIVLTIYLRLNNRSERRFQNRLRIAALLVLIPIGLFTCALLAKGAGFFI